MIQNLLPLDTRIPKWDYDDLYTRTCPICNSLEAEPIYKRPDNLTIRICKRCYTHFISPSPSISQLNEFYKDYDELHRLAPFIDARDLAASYKEDDPFTDVRIRELSSLMKFENSKVLDIGFGRARFLYRLKRLGANPFGLEVDQKAIEYAKSVGIENVFKTDISNFISDIKFDMISLLDLVEHPLNPMDLLRNSTKHLKDGGLLVIWTPNGDFANVEGTQPVTFRVDLEHMQYLTPGSCFLIASELKLRIIHLETLGFPDLKNISQSYSKLDAQSKSNIQPFPSIKKYSLPLSWSKAINHFRGKLNLHKQVKKHRPDERRGNYHLFCIMQNGGLR